MRESEQIEKRLQEIEAMREANYWRAHMQGSMAGYKPIPRAIYEERARLQKRLRELQRSR